jgi:alkylation response protein AidB-like acyl-CoA dehydrogenase
LQFHLTDDQGAIRDTVAAFLADHYDHHARDAIIKAPGQWCPEIWGRLANELGVLGLTFPESAGGMGGGPIDTLLVMDAFGEALVVEPFLETCVIGPALLRRSTANLASDLMRRAAAGTARFALAMEEEGARFAPLRAVTTATRSTDGFVIDGRKTMVVGAPAATHLFVTATIPGEEGGIAIFAVPSDHTALQYRLGRTIDGKGVADIIFSECAVDADALIIEPAEGPSVICETVDVAAAAVCAEAAGIMRRLIRETLGYLEQRRQFGSALIDFQVLQHRLADMQVSYELAHASAFFAAGMLSETKERRTVGISAAKASVCTALRAVAQEAVQMHGAIGITDELAVGHLFKRATALENDFGSIDYHLDRVIAIGLPEVSLAHG